MCCTIYSSKLRPPIIKEDIIHRVIFISFNFLLAVMLNCPEIHRFAEADFQQIMIKYSFCIAMDLEAVARAREQRLAVAEYDLRIAREDLAAVQVSILDLSIITESQLRSSRNFELNTLNWSVRLGRLIKEIMTRLNTYLDHRSFSDYGLMIASCVILTL